MTLDKKDFRILYELDQDSRQSLTRLAKKVRLSRSVVDYRIRKLEQDEVIKGYFTEINTAALGYLTFRILFTCSHTTPPDEKALLEYLKKDPRIIWLFRVVGRWDWDVILVMKSTFECLEFLQEFQTRFNAVIEEKNTAIIAQIYHFPKDYLIGRARQVIKKGFAPLEKRTLSQDEIHILGLLNKNGRASIVEIAKTTKLSVNTTKKYLSNLKKSGVIMGFRPFIDTKKTGYNYYKIHINLRHYTKQDYARFKTYLITNPHIVYFNHSLGGEDVEIELHVQTEDARNDFIKSIRTEFGFMIKDHYIMNFVEEFIYRYLPENV
jgi:Lrp/AsnC family transcriptional regulator, leucine-responsive regulatory protein